MSNHPTLAGAPPSDPPVAQSCLLDTREGPRTGGRTAPIRIAMLDAHPAIHAGFEVLVASEPDLRLIGCARAEAELWPLLRRAEPELVVLDLGPGRLELCFEISRQPCAPALVLYAAGLDHGLVVGAALAGAGAVVSKSSPTAELLGAIRMLAANPRALAPISARMRREAATRLDPADYPIVAMRLAGEPAAEIGGTLGLSPLAIQKRIVRILARLEPVDSAG